MKHRSTKPTNFEFVPFCPRGRGVQGFRQRVKKCQIPINRIRVSAWGVIIPSWMREELEKKEVEKVKISFDNKRNAILIGPSADTGFKTSGSPVAKLLTDEIFQIKIPLICPCEWNEKYEGWIVDLTKGEELIIKKVLRMKEELERRRS